MTDYRVVAGVVGTLLVFVLLARELVVGRWSVRAATVLDTLMVALFASTVAILTFALP